MKYYRETYSLGISIWKNINNHWYNKVIAKSEGDGKYIPIKTDDWVYYKPGLTSRDLNSNQFQFEEISEQEAFIEIL